MAKSHDVATLFLRFGIPLDADEARLRQELARRGWQVELEAPVRDRHAHAARQRR
ncbi:MAG TPA: hypothetical protein VFQ80_14885 [Thermomicrobiales bacterium]|nr:hypothetical protein [Thermomicrobiales bacterium]